MIKKLCAIVFLSLALNLQAQQIPMYNQFHIAPRVYNPSYAGYEGGVNIVLVRNQKWGNFDEGFITNYLSADYLLRGKHGLGINLYNDYVGITSKLKAHLLYSYTVQLGEIHFIRAGAGVGVVDNRIDLGGAVVTDPSDPFLMSLNTKGRRSMFDMNVGINYQMLTDKHNLRFGVSVPQVLGTELVYGDVPGSYYTLERQFLSNLGYTYAFTDETAKVGVMSLKTELLAMLTPGAPFQYNGGLFFEMEKYFWVGAMYKSDYALGINLGINLVPNLKIGLAYDYQIGATASIANAPNIELLLRYNIPPRTEGVPVIDTAALAAKDQEIDSLKKVIYDKEQLIVENEETIAEQRRIIDSLLAAWPDEPTVTTEDTTDADIKIGAPGDYFVELNGSDTPSGYYVIGGAFSEKRNADNLIREVKRTFPAARIIKNLRNDLYYVSLYYSTEKGEGLAYASYKASQLPDEETWILEYKKPDKKPEK